MLSRNEISLYVEKAAKVNIPEDTSPRAYQAIPVNYFDFNNANKRLFIYHSTGAGKTRTAILTALNYIRAYKQIYNSQSVYSPTVFIVGFTRRIFIKELLHNPEFGFVTKEEIETLDKLMRIMQSGETPDNISKYKSMYNAYKTRLTDKASGGFFQFYGYKKFAQLLFSSRDLVSKLHISTIDDSEIAKRLDEAIVSGDLIISDFVLGMLQYSLLITDEAHQMYNSRKKNIYGIAIQYILDRVPSLRALFLSATPLNNHPTEIINMLNLLLEPGEQLVESDIFDNAEVKPGMLKRLGELSYGKVSYYTVDINSLDMPRTLWAGFPMTLKGIKMSGVAFPYSRFADITSPISYIPCVMSSRQFQIHKNLIAGEGNLVSRDGASLINIPTNGALVSDWVFPDIENTKGALFRSNHIKYAYQDAGDYVTTQMVRDRPQLGGTWLGRSELGKWSGKLPKILEIVDAALDEKVFIYHNQVTLGIFIIASMLSQNGYLNATDDVTDLSVCYKCRKTRTQKHQGHEFRPARYLMYYGDMDANAKDNAINRFRADDNMYGEEYLVFIGAKAVREGFDLKSVRHVIISSLPPSISSLMQIIGRAIRSGSHAKMPIEKQTCTISMLLSVFPNNTLGVAHPELYKAMDKARDYMAVQNILKTIKQYSFDYQLYTGYDAHGKFEFDDKRAVAVRYDKNAITMDEYYAHDKYENELGIIKNMIAGAFSAQSTWSHEELREYVKRENELRVHYNSDVFGNDIFDLGIQQIVNRTRIPGVCSNPAITRGSCDYRVMHLHELYIAFPVVDGEPIVDFAARSRHFTPTITSIVVPVEDIVIDRKKYDAMLSIAPMDASFFGLFPPQYYDTLIEETAKTQTPKNVFKFFAGLGAYVSEDGKVNGYKTREYLMMNDGRKIPRGVVQMKPEADIVGFHDKFGQEMRFKIRDTRGVDGVDRRLLSRGIVCTTKKPNDLIAIMNGMSGKTESTKTKNMCSFIMNTLLAKERSDAKYTHYIPFWDR